MKKNWFSTLNTVMIYVGIVVIVAALLTSFWNGSGWFDREIYHNKVAANVNMAFFDIGLLMLIYGITIRIKNKKPYAMYMWGMIYLAMAIGITNYFAIMDGFVTQEDIGNLAYNQVQVGMMTDVGTYYTTAWLKSSAIMSNYIGIIYGVSLALVSIVLTHIIVDAVVEKMEETEHKEVPFNAKALAFISEVKTKANAKGEKVSIEKLVEELTARDPGDN